MAGTHANLEKHWTVDPMAASVTHESGFCVRFITLSPPVSVAGASGESVEEAPLCKCCAKDGREWWVVMTPELFRKTIAELTSRHGPHAAHEVLDRLSREACDFWIGSKMREH